MAKTFRVIRADGRMEEVVAETFKIVDGGALVFKNAASDLPVRCFSGIGWRDLSMVDPE